MSDIRTIADLVTDAASIFRPPERLSVTEAARKYIKLKNPPIYEGPYLPEKTPYMIEPQDMTQSRDHTSVIFCGPSQTGKALDVDTPIATPKGWTTMGDLKVGDTVFDDQGRPTPVVFATEYMYGRDCYSVEFDDGTSIVADAEHTWTVDLAKTEQGYGGQAVADVTTERMRASLTFGKKPRYAYAVKNAGSLRTSRKLLPMAPYTLGAWLGDGHRLGGRIYGAMADLEFIARRVEADGYRTSVAADGKGLGVLRVESQVENTTVRSPFNDMLRKAGIVDKHIPAAYLRASRRQRLDLLKGLMDTDGSADARGGMCEFSNTNEALVDGVRELLATLGIKSTKRKRQTSCTYKGERVDGAVSWRVSFVAYADTPVFTLPRKLANQRARSTGRPGHTQRRRVIAITPVGSRPVKCIQVAASSHLYLAGEQLVPTHNTEAIINNTIGFHIKCNPMDAILFCPSQSTSRDFSKRRIDKMLRHSDELKAELLGGNAGDNTHDKTFRSGMMLGIAWPSINEMSSKPVPVVLFTEYDRMPDDVEGEGSPFMLGKKRTTTFRNLGMTIVDSSPAREVKEPNAKTVGHMAPACTGVLGLYNEGDRRLWYWPCPHCGEFFTASFANLVYDAYKENEAGERVYRSYMEIAKSVYLACPVSGCRIEPHHKQDMNERGVWLRDGEKIMSNGHRYGDPIESDSASFWLKGPAATFTTWQELVIKYLKAYRKMEETGEDHDLRTTVNTDQGEPYIPPSAKRDMLPEDIMETASDAPLGLVPEFVRGLMALVDVQANRFVVQVMGVVPGKPYEIAVIDRFEIIKSKRTDEDGERLWVKPAQELEDWDLIDELVMQKRYPLVTGNGTMGVSMTLCDSGGKEGTTNNAYNFWRKMRNEGKSDRFHLVKGEPELKAPRTRIGYPDSQRSDRHAGARGEIPILFINTNVLKDAVWGMLASERDEDGTIVSRPKIRFPSGLSLEFYAEYTAEVRDAKNRWIKVKPRNESFDLTVYFVAGCINRRVETVDWDSPPPWLAPWPSNPFVQLTEKSGKPIPVDNGGRRTPSLEELGAQLA